jgi:Cys-tRNA(Pro) deacylase
VPLSDLIHLTEFTPGALLSALQAIGVDAELIESSLPMPTVPAAAQAIGVHDEQILKTLLFQDRAGKLVRVVASGPDRINRRLLAESAGIASPSLADPATVLEITGWPAGGVAPVGSRHSLPTIVEARVMDLDRVYGGGGTEHTLIRLRPDDIVRLTRAKIARLTDSAR